MLKIKDITKINISELSKICSASVEFLEEKDEYIIGQYEMGVNVYTGQIYYCENLDLLFKLFQEDLIIQED